MCGRRLGKKRVQKIYTLNGRQKSFVLVESLSTAVVQQVSWSGWSFLQRRIVASTTDWVTTSVHCHPMRESTNGSWHHSTSSFSFCLHYVLQRSCFQRKIHIEEKAKKYAKKDIDTRALTTEWKQRKRSRFIAMCRYKLNSLGAWLVSSASVKRVNFCCRSCNWTKRASDCLELSVMHRLQDSIISIRCFVETRVCTMTTHNSCSNCNLQQKCKKDWLLIRVRHRHCAALCFVPNSTKDKVSLRTLFARTLIIRYENWVRLASQSCKSCVRILYIEFVHELPLLQKSNIHIYIYPSHS